MKKYLIITLSFLYTVSFAQVSPIIERGEVYNKDMVDPILDSLHDLNEYVVTFKIKSSWSNSRLTDYFIMTKKGDQLYAYRYILQKAAHLTPLAFSQKLLENTWNQYLENDLFTIKNERDLEDICPVDSLTEKEKGAYIIRRRVEDSYTYEFILISKEKIKQLSYYSPENYLGYCGKVEERNKVIAAASFMKTLPSQ